MRGEALIIDNDGVTVLRNKVKVLIELDPMRIATLEEFEIEDEEDSSFVESVEIRIRAKESLTKNVEIIDKVIDCLDCKIKESMFIQVEEQEGMLIFNGYRDIEIPTTKLEDFHRLGEEYTIVLEPLLDELGIEQCELVLKVDTIF